jgi:hypothetical protein
MATPKKKSWREDPAGGAPDKQGMRDWQREGDKGGRGGGLSLWWKRVLAGGLFVIVAAVAVIVALWPKKVPPPALVLIGAGYETNLGLPANAHGRRALDDLQGWAKDFNKGRPEDNKLDVQREDLTDGDPVANAVGKIKAIADPSKFKKDRAWTAVIFISAHGGADDRGAFLFFDRSNPGDPAGVYRMEQALKVLQDKLPDSTNKLLILDVTAVPDAWAMRMLHNDFVRALEADLGKTKVQNLYVLVSSDKDQRAWRSDVLRRSVFAHFAVEGLKGAVGEDVVTVGNLAEYVRREVRKWAVLNRAAVQEPLLIGDEARAKDVRIVQITEKYQPTDPPGAADLAGVAGLWKERDALESGGPSPLVHTPHLWRRYLEMTARCEDLMRLGETEAAGKANAARLALARQIDEARRYGPPALGNSLPLPQALGHPLPEAMLKEVSDRFALFERDEKTPPERVVELLRSVDASDVVRRAQMRVALTRRLLAAARKSEADLKRACGVLEKLAAADGGLLPAEADLAIFLSRSSKRPLDFELVKLALDVSALAEQAALAADGGPGPQAAAEQVLPWVRGRLDEADGQRRAAQDLLFLSPEQRRGAEPLLRQAEKGYKEVLEKAAVVHRALGTHADAIHALPYLTHWRSRAEAEPKDADELAERKEKLWAKVHELTEALATPSWDRIDGLREKEAAVRAGLDALRADFDKAAGQDYPGDNQGNWHAIDDILRCPLVRSDDRVRLAGRLRDIGVRLQKEAGEAKEDAPSAEATTQRAERTARRQARLALAMLGKDASEKARTAVNNAAQPDQWAKSLDAAGDAVGESLQGVGSRAANAARTARGKAPAEAVALLRSPALSARLIGAAAAEAQFAEADPFDELRRDALHELLVGQAQRAGEDYWGEVDRDKPEKPSYRVLGRLYVSAASSLLGEGKGLSDEAKAARDRPCADLSRDLNESDRFGIALAGGFRKVTEKEGDRVVEKTVVDVTDERWLLRTSVLQAPKKAPRGTAALWPQVGPSDDASAARALLVGPFDDKAPGQPPPKDPLRLALPGFADPNALKVVWRLEKGEGRDKDKPTDDVGLQLAGFYRGREFSLPATVRLHNRPTSTAVKPSERPQTGSIALQAGPKLFDEGALGKRQIVFVLDGSGSMNKQSQGGKRFENAKAALLETIGQLPDGINVGLLFFNDPKEKGGWAEVRQIWPPEGRSTTWDRGTHLQQLREVVEKQKASGGTPLVASLQMAKAKLGNAPGSKTIVVLTDGGEWDRPDGDEAKTARKRDLVALIKGIFPATEKGPPPVKVMIVKYEVNQADLEPVEKANLPFFEEGIKAVGGELFDAKDRGALREALARAAFRRLTFRIDTQSGRRPFRIDSESGLPLPVEDFDVSEENNQPFEGVRWIHGLEHGANYKVALKTARENTGFRQHQRVSVDAGDFMLLRLVKQDKDILFRRELYAPQVSQRLIDRAPRGDARWLAAVLQNEAMPRNFCNGLQMLVVLEKGRLKDDPDVLPDDLLVMARPSWVWFEVTPEAARGEPVPGLKFYPVYDYPAPAWSLEYLQPRSGWPDKKKPVVGVWWRTDRIDSEERVTTDLRRGKDFADIKELQGKAVDAGVVIESVTHETRLVDAEPNDPNKPKQERQCLVVRLRYPDGRKPYFVLRPEGIGGQVRGEEHRFYAEAGRYTGVFWDVDADAAKNLSRLQVVSVEKLKTDAGVKTIDGGLALPSPPGRYPRPARWRRRRSGPERRSPFPGRPRAGPAPLPRGAVPFFSGRCPCGGGVPHLFSGERAARPFGYRPGPCVAGGAAVQINPADGPRFDLPSLRDRRWPTTRRSPGVTTRPAAPPASRARATGSAARTRPAAAAPHAGP